MSRTNGVQGLQGFELLVECSYAAREAVIQVDDLEDLLLRDEPQFATEVNMVRDALVLLRTVADALHAARTDARAEVQQALQGSADKWCTSTTHASATNAGPCTLRKKKALIVSTPKIQTAFFLNCFKIEKKNRLTICAM